MSAQIKGDWEVLFELCFEDGVLVWLISGYFWLNVIEEIKKSE